MLTSWFLSWSIATSVFLGSRTVFALLIYSLNWKNIHAFGLSFIRLNWSRSIENQKYLKSAMEGKPYCLFWWTTCNSTRPWYPLRSRRDRFWCSKPCCGEGFPSRWYIKLFQLNSRWEVATPCNLSVWIGRFWLGEEGFIAKVWWVFEKQFLV